MTPPDELRRLAEAARDAQSKALKADCGFELANAADPATILALLDERDRLRAFIDGLHESIASGFSPNTRDQEAMFEEVLDGIEERCRAALAEGSPT